MTTASGGRFWPLDPRAEDVSLADIACSLAKTPRYRGHTRAFYSVAEHSVLLARHVEGVGARRDLVAWALMHDAAEAYCCDVPSPIKAVLPGFAAIEERIESAVAQAFGLRLAGEVPRWVRDADVAIRGDEFRQLGLADHDGGFARLTPLGVTLELLAPDQAEAVFLDAAARWLS